MAGYTADIGGRVMPPLLRQQECLVIEIERPSVPFRLVEPLVLRQWLDAWWSIGFRLAGRAIQPEAHGFSQCFLCQFHLFCGRNSKMGQPVMVSQSQGGRGKPERGASQEC